MNKIILVSEDDPLLRALLNDIIETLGFDTIFAQDGLEALMLVKAQKKDRNSISLIISDVDIPGFDGIELIKEIHKSEIDIPVIAIVAVDKVAQVSKLCKELKFKYITKPFDVKVLIDVINQTLS